ncbi:C40 family peptidase [Albibacterium indicum]|uniref:C40 family peptidase n=1 Tax=Albibacterium indicum TaxID=2292082 RepID=UPI000E4E1FB0|nr:NlpC/P60 family protein [Pedobacter indicus]
MKSILNKLLLIGILTMVSNSLSAQNWINVKDTENFDKWRDFVVKIKDTYAPDSRDIYLSVYDDEEQAGKYVIETTSTEIQSYVLNEEKGSTFTVKLLPDSDLNGKTKGIINLSVANLRTRPSHSAEMATQTLLGTPVDVLKKLGGYYLIRTPEGYLAYVDRYGVQPKTEEELANWTSRNRAIYVADYGHAYLEANTTSPRVSDLVMGNILTVVSEGEDYWQLEYPDGRLGYVESNRLMKYDDWKAMVKPQADSVLQVAKRMIGVPYLWGGTSIKGVDCSGFTKTSYFMNGLIIPRDASQQYRQGEELNIMTDGDLDVKKAVSNLKKGDLIFFSASKETNPKQPITHVAIYMDNGEFIHAAGIVRINSFDPTAPNYDSQSLTIVGARRYLDNEEFIASHTLNSKKGY